MAGSSSHLLYTVSGAQRAVKAHGPPEKNGIIHLTFSRKSEKLIAQRIFPPRLRRDGGIATQGEESGN
jgi:hypothetical protein